MKFFHFFILNWRIIALQCCVRFLLYNILLYIGIRLIRVFPGGSVVKNPPANARDAGSIAGSGRCPGEENDNPF